MKLLIFSFQKIEVKTLWAIGGENWMNQYGQRVMWVGNNRRGFSIREMNKSSSFTETTTFIDFSTMNCATNLLRNELNKKSKWSRTNNKIHVLKQLQFDSTSYQWWLWNMLLAQTCRIINCVPPSQVASENSERRNSFSIWHSLEFLRCKDNG